MKSSLKTILLNKHILKIYSIIFGYLFWVILVQNQTLNIASKAPLCFYGLKDNLEITAPESIELTLSGKRLDLSNFDLIQTAVHIDASKYNQGDYEVRIKESNIFLHNKIKLVDYFPAAFLIKVKEKK